LAEAIRVEGLEKKYVTKDRIGLFKSRKKVIRALKGVFFKVERGEILSLLGPNGAGKTTTIKILATILIPDSGTAYINGYDILRERDKVRTQIGVTFSVERGFYPRLTGFENLVYFGMLQHLSRSEAKRRAREMLEIVDLSRDAHRLFDEYSLGMKAKLALARAMLHDPPILMLDEPTIGLDPVAAKNIRNLLLTLRERGKTILLTTHNMSEADTLSDHIAMINGGEIVAYGTPEELKARLNKLQIISITLQSKGRDPRVFLMDIGSIIRVSENSGVSVVKIGCKKGEEMDVLYMALRKLRESGFNLLRVEVESPTLEDVFVEVARGEFKKTS